MNLICLNCGEAWGLGEVPDAPEAGFEHKGWVLTHCPACTSRLPYLEQFLARFREQLEEIADAGWSIEGEQDRLSSNVEDFLHAFFREPTRYPE